MTIALVNATSNKGVAANWSVAQPSGSGGMLRLYINSASVGVATPSGWTLEKKLDFGATTPNQELLVFSRYADGTEGSTFSGACPTPAYGWSVVCERWSGVAPSGAVDVIGTASAGYGAAPINVPVPGVTSTTDGSLLQYICGAYNNAADSVTGYSTPTGFSNATASGVDQYASVFVASKQLPTHGATGTVAGTISVSSSTCGWGAILLVLKPAATESDAVVAATSAQSIASGVASSTATGSGAATCRSSIAAGAAASGAATGTGAVTTAKATAAGVADAVSIAAANATANTASATGAAAVISAASSNTVASPAVAAGEAVSAMTTGSGAVTAPGATSVGAAFVTANASGAATANEANAQGFAGLQASIGEAAVVAAPSSATAIASITSIAVGIAIARAASAAGNAQVNVTATGVAMVFAAPSIARGFGTTITAPASPPDRTMTFAAERRKASFAPDVRVALFSE